MISGRISVRLGLCACPVLALAACASTPEPIVGVAASAPRTEMGQEIFADSAPGDAIYLLRPTDRISVTVFREPDFSLDAQQIGLDGNVSMPLLGSIPAAGMTAAQFERDVTRRLATAGLRNPLVSVNISELSTNLVTVEGAVEQPGVYPFQPGARLSAAVAMAQGPARTANVQQVAVFRETPEGIMVAKFDYEQVSQGLMLDPILQPRDRVFMGTDGLSVFWQDFLRALPAFGIFANPSNF